MDSKIENVMDVTAAHPEDPGRQAALAKGIGMIQVKNAIAGVLFAAGIILAGSDGDWFPWINLAGIGILAGVTYYANIAHRRAPWR
jgi:uncharacterized membrane protein